MTILSQAETIRDETAASANTATRVGTCLVDIANVLIAPAANIAAASFTMEGSATAIPDDQFYPISAISMQSVKTSADITISQHTTPDYAYFSGLTVGKIYKYEYSLSVKTSKANITVSFVPCNLAGDQLEAARTLEAKTANQFYSFSATTMIQTQTSGEIVLYMKISDPTGATVTAINVSPVITYLGDAVV